MYSEKIKRIGDKEVHAIVELMRILYKPKSSKHSKRTIKRIKVQMLSMRDRLYRYKRWLIAGDGKPPITPDQIGALGDLLYDHSKVINSISHIESARQSVSEQIDRQAQAIAQGPVTISPDGEMGAILPRQASQCAGRIFNRMNETLYPDPIKNWMNNFPGGMQN